MKVAAIADLHCKTNSHDEIRKLLEGVDRLADVLVLAGDLTNRGLLREMEVLLEALAAFDLPMVAVLGNHDHENDQGELLVKLMASRDICVLESTTCLIGNTAFIGTKGFCGGFDENRIQPFGERAIKAFVQTSINEVVNMESALKTLDGRHRIGVLHYAPIKETLQGESPELFPFLGSSLIAEAFDRHGADVIFHGHAHNGARRGQTRKGIPVYNVSRFVRTDPDYLIHEL